MSFLEDIIQSFLLIFSSDEIWQITGLSLIVSVSAVVLAASLGIPLGVYLGHRRKQNFLLVTLINTGMGLPPVVVGLVVYLMLSRQGSLGFLQILFTPMAMIIAQMILTLPMLFQ